MSPWLVPGSPVYRIRIRGKSWRLVVSTGMRDGDGAREVEAFASRLYDRRRWDILDAIKAKQLALADAFDADRRGQLEDVLRTINDVDLSPLVDEWAKEANAKYVKQVRRFIVAGRPMVRSSFTKAAIKTFLADLPVSGPTRNRYRAACSVFCRWLVERDILEHNPVRDISGYKENEPRDKWMTWADAQRVAERAPEPYRTLFLLMAGTGMEWGACERLRLTDIDLTERTINVHGTKTRWRRRVIRAEPFVWVALTVHCHGLIGNAPVFAFGERSALFHLREACAAAGMESHRLHDLRHTYAVNALKAGLKPQVVAHQLGHKDATMVTRVYGKYLPDESDYQSHSPAQPTSRNARGAK